MRKPRSYYTPVILPDNGNGMETGEFIKNFKRLITRRGRLSRLVFHSGWSCPTNTRTNLLYFAVLQVLALEFLERKLLRELIRLNTSTLVKPW